MNLPRILFLLLLSACAGTDLVEDTLASLEIVPPGDVTIVNGNFAKLVGETASLGLIATSDLGGSFEFDEAVWSSSDMNVISVSENGRIEALSTGNAFVTAEAMGISSEPILIAVIDDAEAVAIIEVSAEDNNAILEAGSTLQLASRALNVTGSEVTSVEVTWASDNEQVATVDQNGLVTGVSDGMVRISVSSGTAQGFLDLTIGSSEALTRSGEIQGLNGYRASGSVALTTNTDGSLQLEFSDNFSIQNGPGLYVYLSNSSNGVAGGIELGDLRSTSGADTYEIPAGVAINDFDFVILYCKPFGVGFGTAALSN